jgi:hypothetical protein
MPVAAVDPIRRLLCLGLTAAGVFAAVAAALPSGAIASASPTKPGSIRPATASFEDPHLPAPRALDRQGLRSASLSDTPHPLAPGQLGPGVAQPSLLHRSGESVRDSSTRADVLYSTNWSGQILFGGSYSGIGGGWTVPAVAPSTSAQYSATWIGIDGTTSSTLIQTGTAQETSGGVTNYYAWVELLPGAEQTIVNAPVAPGDQIQAEIVETSLNVWTVQIADTTQGWMAGPQPLSYTTPGASVEWIEEAPTVGGSQSTLANFGAMTFTNLAASTVGTGSALFPMAMLNPGQTNIIAYPGPYDSATNSFSDFYGAPVPIVTSVTPSQGTTSGGTGATIQGDFLIGTTAVDFASTSASFTMNTDGSIATVSPAESLGTVDVTVTTPGGTSAPSAADRFTYVDPGVYVPLAPVRVCDTRAGNPSHLSGPAAQCSNGTAGERLASNGTVTFALPGSFGVPSSAVTAVVLNVTAAGASAAGYLTAFPAGESRPTASNLDFFPGHAVPNLAEVALGSGGAVSIFSPSPVDVVVDLEGYVTTTLQGGAGLYNALATPARICDTRGSNPSHLSGGATQCNPDVAPGSRDQLVTSTAPLAVTVAGNGGVPSTGVSAIVLNVTVTRPTAAGFVTAFPTGQTQPLASNLNYLAGQTVANRVIVPVGTNGQVTLASPTPTDVVVDVSGWYTATGGTTGAEFTPEVTPARICDTRGSNPSQLVAPSTQCNTNVASGSPANPLVAGAARTIQSTGIGDAPSGATAAVLNVTDIRPSAPSYLAVYPQGSPPSTSDVNPPVGGVQANLAVATLATAGSFQVFDGGSGTTNLVVDVAGWYTTPA